MQKKRRQTIFISWLHFLFEGDYGDDGRPLVDPKCINNQPGYTQKSKGGDPDGAGVAQGAAQGKTPAQLEEDLKKEKEKAELFKTRKGEKKRI